MILKQSTGYARKFVMISTSDHIAGKTGLNGAVTVYLSKGPGAAGTLAANSGAGVVELDATNLPGAYQIQLTAVDTTQAGDLYIRCTGAGADPTDFVDQVQSQVFTDLSVNASGLVSVTSNLKQSQPFTALFFMTLSGTNNPAPGLTITGQRTFGVAGFSNITGTIQEVGFPAVGTGGGWYVLNGAAADSASAAAGFKMSATGANDSDFSLWFQP
jgi:hypothetical protein